VIQYKKVANNKAVGFLSRPPVQVLSVLGVQYATYDFLKVHYLIYPD
jgi:hypothetical protein